MDIFLSYASEDHSTAEEIALALRGEGHEVFFDRAILSGGEDFHSVIRDEIHRADLFVFLIAPESVAQGSYALTELRMARERWKHPGGHILPVLLRPTALEQIPPYLRGVTLFEPEGNVAAELAAHVRRPRRRLKLVPTLFGILVVATAGYVAFPYVRHLMDTGKEGFVSRIAPSDFLSRFVFEADEIERAEYALDPSAPFPADRGDVVSLERIAFGTIADSATAFNISVALTNTTERPILLDITPRFFELVDDQGQEAELLFFCCEASGEMLDPGARRQIQLIYRSPPGWEGKEITTQLIHFRVLGLIPLVRGTWVFRPLATAA
jgi:hypothetical protein